MEPLALAFVNLIALVACWVLVRQGPCWMAKLTMLLLSIAALFLVVGYVVTILEPEVGRHVVAMGYYIEHSAVLLTVFRLHWQRGEQKWASSLVKSRG